MTDTPIKAPCKGCEKREVGCHARCEGYLAFAKQMEKRREERQTEWAVRDVQLRSIFQHRHSLGKRISGKPHVISQY